MMRGYRLLVLMTAVYLVFGGISKFTGSIDPVPSPSGKGSFLVYADGRYWLVDEEGYLMSALPAGVVPGGSVVCCVDLEGIRVVESDLNVMNRLRPVLENPVTSEVSIRGKYVITVKGIVLYFQRWEDLLKYYDAFVKRMKRLAPRSRFFLHESGKLVVLRGD